MWDMPGKGEPLLGRLVRNGEEGFPGQAAVDFDEVGALLLQGAHGLAGFDGVTDHDRTRPDWMGSIHNRTGDDQARAKQGALLDLLPPRVMPWHTPHQSHTCHPIRDED